MDWRSSIQYSLRRVWSWWMLFLWRGSSRYTRPANQEIEKQGNIFREGFMVKSFSLCATWEAEAYMKSQYHHLFPIILFKIEVNSSSWILVLWESCVLHVFSIISLWYACSWRNTCLVWKWVFISVFPYVYVHLVRFADLTIWNVLINMIWYAYESNFILVPSYFV